MVAYDGGLCGCAGPAGHLVVLELQVVRAEVDRLPLRERRVLSCIERCGVTTKLGLTWPIILRRSEVVAQGAACLAPGMDFRALLVVYFEGID